MTYYALAILLTTFAMALANCQLLDNSIQGNVGSDSGSPPPPANDPPPATTSPMELNWNMGFNDGVASKIVANGSGNLTLTAPNDRTITNEVVSLANLKAQWLFTGTPGVLADGQSFGEPVGGHNLTLRDGATAGSATLEDFDFDQSVRLDGVDDYLEMPANLDITQNVSALSVSLWVKYDDVTTSLPETLVGFSTGVTNALSRFEIKTNRSYIEFNSRALDTDSRTTFTHAQDCFSAGVWTHIVAIADYASAEEVLYVNGQEVFTLPSILYGSNTTSNTPSIAGSIGSEDNGTGGYFDGSIGQVLVWDRVLSSTEIANIYTHQSHIYQRGVYTSVPTLMEDHLTNLNLSWQTSFPLMKHLPVNSQNETNFGSANIITSNGLGQSILYYNFEEPNFTNTITDQSGQGQNATCALTCPSQVPGKIGQGMQFNGLDEVLEIANFTPPQKGSILIWILMPYSTGFTRILGATDDFELKMSSGYFDNDLFAGGGGNTPSLQLKNSLQWQMFVATWDFISGESKVYVDGLLNNTQLNADDDPLGPFTLSIGTRTAKTDFFKGTLDELMIFNRVLTDAEVLNIFRRQEGEFKVQLRTCVDIFCSDNLPFAGPNGSQSLFFTETAIGFNLNPSFDIGAFLMPNQFIQVRIELGSDGRNFNAPELLQLNISGQ